MPILKTSGTKIFNGKKEVNLRGVNLGGWLMMEAYILHAPNFAERLFKQKFAAAHGGEALDDFERSFRDNFIREDDIRNIAGMGMNCIRLPFNHRLIEKEPFVYDAAGLKYLDDLIKWAGKNRIWVVLDLHGAQGSQNHDWHSDSVGKAELWTKAANRKRVCVLWEMLADRYKNEEWVAGYNIINEPVMHDTGLLNGFYREAIAAVRRSDKEHIIILEGNTWSTNIECLDEFEDDNYVLQFHSYEPLSFTFNFIPLLHYPCKRPPVPCGTAIIRRHLAKYAKLAKQRGVPVYNGEFGVNFREGKYGELLWLEDNLAAMRELGINWTYWTYKAVKNSAFPDGVYSYYGNPAWVHREGPVSGWDTYVKEWPLHKKEMIDSWRTENFRANTGIVKLLKQYSKK
jgi:aryl-phospho-beta-D-glucosidase BglC (GH1 family)